MVYNQIISIVSNQRLGYVLLLVLFVFTNVACTQKKGITDDCSEKLATIRQFGIIKLSKKLVI